MSAHPTRGVGRRAFGFGLGAILVDSDASAQTGLAIPPPPPPATNLPLGVRSGQDLFTILGSTLIGTYTQIADDISRVLSAYQPSGPRVLTVLAGGGLQAVHDLVRLDAFTGGIFSSVVLDVIRRANWLPELTERLVYVTELYQEEVHIVSSQLYPDLVSLNGKPVNVGPLGGGTDVIARRMFELLEVHPLYDNRATLVALPEVATGGTAAVVYIAGKPVPLFRDFGPVGNLFFMPIRVPVELRAAVAGSFRSAVLLPSDYPNFVPAGTQVDTLSSAVFLMMRNRYTDPALQQGLDVLETNFVSDINTLQIGASVGIYHPKWREVSVFERLPGFRRAPALLQWFNANANPD